MNRYVLSILVNNNSGVLSRVTGLFSRRGYNIESLSVGITEEENISRITVVTVGDDTTVDQILKQVNKLVEVKKVVLLDDANSVCRELMLVKIRATKSTRGQILEISNIFRAKVVDVAKDSVVIEATGNNAKLEAMLGLLEPFEILELVRTGLAGISRGAKLLK